MHAEDTMSLTETRLAQQLLSDQAPPVSSALQTDTTLVFTWRGQHDRLVVEITIDRRAHWRYQNRGNQVQWAHSHDADEGWPAEGKRYLMRFNRRVA